LLTLPLIIWFLTEMILLLYQNFQKRKPTLEEKLTTYLLVTVAVVTLYILTYTGIPPTGEIPLIH
jgi:uncharacterized membrane protein YobD (UPF0266 family)